MTFSKPDSSCVVGMKRRRKERKEKKERNCRDRMGGARSNMYE